MLLHYILTQEVESMLHQLSEEQQEVDSLRAAVAKEREEVARETAHVAALAKVTHTAPNRFMYSFHGHWSVIMKPVLHTYTCT